MTKTDNPDYVTLPELIAYAREHGCELDAAFQHFRDIGRTAPVAPLAPIRDGWQPPAVTFQFSPRKNARSACTASRPSKPPRARDSRR